MSGTGWSLIGRGRQLAELEAALDGAVAGTGGLVLVAGEAGIGKTRLCEELVTLARARDIDVSTAACWESGTVPAYWPWEQLVLRLTGAHLRPGTASGATSRPGLPASPPADPDLARAQLFEDVTALLAHASAERPRLLLIDDLHWADIPSVRLLAHVALRLREMPVLAVTTYRSDEATVGTPLGAALVDLVRHGHRIALTGLDPADMAPLLESITGTGAPAATAVALHRHTHGNPLFARELVRLLDARGLLATLGDTIAGGGTGGGPGGQLPVPDTVRGVLDGRLERPTPACRAVLEIGAVVGDVLALDVVAAAVAPEQEPALLDLVDEAVAAGVLREAGVGRYAFGHPLMRAALYEELGVARRVRLHQRVGEALEARLAAGHEVDLAALSHHFVRAAPAGTAAKAVGYAREAAGRAMAMLAYEDAAALARQALAALDLAPSAADRGDLLLGLGAALAASGDLPAARTVHLQVAALARAAGRSDQLARAALGVGGGGAFEVRAADREQVDLLEEALRALAGEPSGLRSEVGARLSVALWQTGEEGRRAVLADEALADARAGHDVTPAALAAALAAHCDVIAGPADVDRRFAEAGEIVEIGTGSGDRAIELLGRRLRLVARLEAGDVAGADAEVEAYAGAVGLIRRPLYAWYVPLWRGMRALMAGDVAACGRLAGEAAEIGARAHSENADVLTKTLRWYRFREEYRLQEPLMFLDDLLDMVAAFGVQTRVVLALITADAGRLADARTHLDAAAPGFATMPVDSEWVASLAQAGEAAWLIGGHALAGPVYEALLPFRHRHGVEGIGAFCWGSVERPLGFLAGCLGRPEEAAAHFDAALAANRALAAPLLVARTLRDGGVVLGDPARLAAALAAYRELGIPGRVGELEALLADGPVEPVEPGPAAAVRPAAAVHAPVEGSNRFRLDGQVWTLVFAGATVHVRDVKGLRDLARLLANPGREVAAVDLAGRTEPHGGHLGDVVDERAREAYKARLVALEAELDDADATGDATRSARVQQERDALLGQLSAAYGLGGRPRRAGDPAEKARVAVTWRIRDAIGRVETVHPELGRHLRRSVRTGTFCAYDPDPPTAWSL